MVGGNQAGVKLSTAAVGNTQRLPPPSGLLHLPLLQMLAPPSPPPPSSSHSSANQQICDLSVVMNRGRLQPWLPPQAQMDDSGLLKCFLRHSGWHSQGERRWAMLCFITPFFFLMMFTLPVARPEIQSEHLARRHLHNYGDSFFLLSSPHFIFPCQPILKFEPPVCSSSPVTSKCWQDVSNCSTF